MLSAQELSELCHQASAFLGRELQLIAPLSGGDEALVFHMQSPSLAEQSAHEWVLHLSPAWRKAEELRWCHRLTQYLHQHLPCVIAPHYVDSEDTGLPESLFFWQGRPAALFPYISGSFLERHPEQRAQAARLLAHIHRLLQNWQGPPRPKNPQAPAFPDPEHWPAIWHDPELEQNWLRFLTSLPLTGLTHGDYYGENILCRGPEIVGVIDWYEAQRRPLLLELAGACFEICRTEAHELDLEHCRSFIASYLQAGGPIPAQEQSYFKTVMRSWIRQDALNSVAWGSDWQDAYVQAQAQAFLALKELNDAWFWPQDN